jgi:hypothetical protein
MELFANQAHPRAGRTVERKHRYGGLILNLTGFPGHSHRLLRTLCRVSSHAGTVGRDGQLIVLLPTWDWALSSPSVV